MKLSSNIPRLSLLVLVIIAVVSIVAIRAFAQSATPRPVPSDRKITLKFKEAELKDGTASTFKRAVRDHLKGEQYSLRIKFSETDIQEVNPTDGASIKTDSVEKSGLAASSDVLFTAIGIHVTQTVTANTMADIKPVLDTLK